MEKVILTEKNSEGIILKNKLMSFDSIFCDIQNYDLQDLLNNPKTFNDTIYIFSTWNMPVFNEIEIKRYFPSLKAIFYSAGTVKYFAEPFLKLGVRVFSAAKANAIPVAEFVCAQILLANKGYFQAQREYKKPFWKRSFFKARNYSLKKKGNYNAKIGIIGCGAVGTKVIEFLKPYNFQIYVYDPYLSKEKEKLLKIEKVDLKDIFINCDVISNHLPDIPETKGLINYNLFSLMKESATFINTGRGAQVIERDLIRVIRKKPNTCALLDVTKREPLWPWSPLLRMKNIFLSPHIAGTLSDEFNRLVEEMVKTYFYFIKGNKSSNEVFLNDLKIQA